MTATNHAITGALIATVIKNPAVAVTLAFIAHFVMDAIPHFRVAAKDDKERFKKRIFYKTLIIDLTLAFLLLIIVPTFILTSLSWWLVFACMLACMSPDLAWGWRLFLAVFKNAQREKNLFSRFHTWIQWSESQTGIVVELVWFITTLSLVIERR